MKPCKQHDFREFWKTNYWGRLVLKEVRCIYCDKIKKEENGKRDTRVNK